MKFNCGPKSVWMPIVVGLAAVIALPFVAPRISPKPDETPPAPAPAPGPSEPVRPPDPAPPAPPKAEPDTLREWRSAVIRHDKSTYLIMQEKILAKESEFRERLVELLHSDADPRVRAHCITLLGRFKSPPNEGEFLYGLADSSEYGRLSALDVLGRIGSRASLESIDRLAKSDPVLAVRAAAEQAAKAVRSR